MAIKLVSISVVILMLLTHSEDAYADGKDLYGHCQTAVRALDGEELSEIQGGFASACMMYIIGFLEGHLVVSMRAATNDLDVAIWCEPEKWVVSEAVRIYVDYSKQHPEQLHLPEGIVLVNSLRDAFPCK